MIFTLRAETIWCYYWKYTVLFLKMYFSISFDETSLQRCKYKILVKTVKPFGRTKQFCILHLPLSYHVSLIMVTITRHIFINNFQMDHYSAVEFDRGY